ncbi:MAG TPA: ParB/RepB/Spo0J family partition protein [Clostridiales bacterium]|jgi:ParB family chromosome partitioning protein|nr:ParB/RepB/Spo0J family partition protein [Clostridiales bacterium]
MKKNALGRGLDALLPRIEQESQVRDIPLKDIDINQSQPRKAFDEQSLQELAQSIQEVGLLQPILVTEHRNRYRIVAGERRFRAARLAGLSAVPCIVREFTANEQMEAALVENLQREDLNAIEEAQAVQALMQAAGYTQEQVAQRLGKSRPAVANLLRLLALPEAIQQMVVAGALSQGHARALAAVADPARQLRLAQRVVKEGLSVRELEQLCAQQAPRPQRRSPRPAPELQDLAERLRQAVGVKTQVDGSLTKGKITLFYQTQDELETIYEATQRLLEND